MNHCDLNSQYTLRITWTFLDKQQISKPNHDGHKAAPFAWTAGCGVIANDKVPDTDTGIRLMMLLRT